MQEGCKPRFCVLRRGWSLGTGGMVPCCCPSGSARRGRCWAWQLHPNEASGSGRSQAWGPRKTKCQKKMSHGKQINCCLNSATLVLGTRVKFRCLTPSQLAPSLFGTAPNCLPVLSDKAIFVTAGGTGIHQETISLDGVGCFSTEKQANTFPFFVALVWSLVTPSVMGGPAVTGSCTERCPAPRAPTTARSNAEAVVTANFLLSSNHLNSACVILLLFM